QRIHELEAAGKTQEAEAEKARLSKLVGYSQADVSNLRDAKDSAASTAGTVAATAAGVAVIVCTAGTATPLVAVAAMATTGGALAKVATSGAIEGSGYSADDARHDAVTGAIDGGTAVIGMGGGAVAGKAVVAGSEVAAETAARKLLTAGDMLEKKTANVMLEKTIEGAKIGFKGGAAGGGLSAAVDENTWKDGIGEGFERIGASTLTGGATGFVAGGVLSGALSGLGA
ncbi:unnamed protein product, partial [Phaeothamnion confervicola]